MGAKTAWKRRALVREHSMAATSLGHRPPQRTELRASVPAPRPRRWSHPRGEAEGHRRGRGAGTNPAPNPRPGSRSPLYCPTPQPWTAGGGPTRHGTSRDHGGDGDYPAATLGPQSLGAIENCPLSPLVRIDPLSCDSEPAEGRAARAGHGPVTGRPPAELDACPRRGSFLTHRRAGATTPGRWEKCEAQI